MEASVTRYGVAPDHPEVKNVINQFTKVATKPNINFYGNISLGKDITLYQLRQHYDAVLLTYGAEEDKFLGIENEQGQNIVAARNFVGWYNGHPRDTNLKVDLSGSTAAILGQGNVALDVARILLTPIDILRKTDITEHALSTLAESKNSIFTGFLRDGVKRIDLVLVINDDGDGKVEMFRVNFLNNVIKAGLEIELESGVESHEEFINVGNKFQGMANERELIKAVRMHDLGPINYSSLERSIIVYRVLLSLPFGFHENYFGLNRVRTDYNRGKSVNSEIPCWEKEYELCPIDEDFLNDKYMSLALAHVAVHRAQISGSNLHFRHPEYGRHGDFSLSTLSRFMYKNIPSNTFPELNNNFNCSYFQALLETCSFPIMLEKFIPLNRYWEAKRLKWWFIFFYEESLIGTNVPETFAARTFRDGVRKIDLIIVTKDDQDTENEKHRVNYLINIVKFGLEIELEPGIMQIHKNVVFVKVHAPDTVLYEYGKVFGFRRFKNSRDEFLKMSYDWEWINIVR
ncbi:unnamed protein product, partial [Iphiclides podalirius]